MLPEKPKKPLLIFFPHVLEEDEFPEFISQIENREIILSQKYLDDALTWISGQYNNGDTIIETITQLLQIAEASKLDYQLSNFTIAAINSLLDNEISLDQRFNALNQIYTKISNRSNLSDSIKEAFTSMFIGVANLLRDFLETVRFDSNFEDRIQNNLYLKHIIDLQEIVSTDLIPSLNTAGSIEFVRMTSELSESQQKILLLVLEMSLVTGITNNDNFNPFLEFSLYTKLEINFIKSFSLSLKRLTELFKDELLNPRNPETVVRITGFIRSIIWQSDEFWTNGKDRLDKYILLAADFLNLIAQSKEKDIQEAIKAIFTGMFKTRSEIQETLVRSLSRALDKEGEIDLNDLNFGLDPATEAIASYHNRVRKFMPNVAKLMGEIIPEKKEQ